MAGMNYREKTFARQKELGISRQRPNSHATIPTCRSGIHCRTEEKKLYARMMEVFAGFLTHTDHHYGRLFDFLKTMGELDNTIIMFISDNGASSEGGPTGSVNESKFFNNVPDSLEENSPNRQAGRTEAYNHYAWGWTFAGNTPFRRWKRETFAAASAIRSLSTGRRGSRRREKCARSMRTPSIWCRRCSRRRHRSPDEHQGRHPVADQG